MMKTIFAILTVISVTLVACQPSSGLHARSQAHLLKQHMPETEVVSLIGKPDKISILTCGSDTDAPWFCKKHEYTEYISTIFTVYYYELSGDWYLNDFITH